MATERTMFTGLNKDSFNVGFRWARSVKQTALTIMVVNMGLEDEQVEKLKELGVKVVPNTNKTGVNQVDLFNSFLAAQDDLTPGTYLFWDVEVQAENVGALWGATCLVAPPLKEINIPTLVFPLTTIDARVKVGARLESDVIGVDGKAYFGGLIAGRMEDWRLFVGLYNNLVETGVVETLISARNLVLNLFALYFPGHVESKPVEYEISALQPDKSE